MFEYLYYFCNRDRENLRELTKGDFTIGMDSSGREFVVVRCKQTKNHRGDDLHDVDNKQGRMYDKPGDSSCPVASFKKYVSKLHADNSSFWQRPKKQVDEDNSKWYDNVSVGKNALYTFMQKLSQDYHLCNRYTNHCVRATSIIALDHSGVEARHIMGVSGHKNESSIKCYSSKLSDDKKRQMSDILSENIAPPSKCVKICATSTASRTSTVSLMSQPAPVPPVKTLSDIPDLLGEDEIDILLSQINEQECTLSAHPSPSSKVNSKPLANSFNFSNCQITFNVSK